MLTWIMFLNFLDDLELQREQEWQLAEPDGDFLCCHHDEVVQS